MPTSSPALPLLKLPPDEVHVWIVEPERITEPGLLESYRALLDPGERDKQQRFYFERHRLQYLVSHALVRLTLSRYAPVAPEAWSFSANQYGRPEIRGEEKPWLRFNLSHTDGMALCAVARDVDVGADVEDTERRGETVEIADSFFAPAEVASLRALPVSGQRERFFDYWTLKEAYIKARGMGLSLPLDQFAFEVSQGLSTRISFDPRLVDEPSQWQFVRFRPSQRHAAALAVRRPSEAPLTVRFQRTVPLQDDAPAEYLSRERIQPLRLRMPGVGGG
ncbi:4'-phosphopantetheinyl transferase family protein [Stigmatella aurantiaca]|uniref:MtaA n=2 Tax=Stigmatella aurantiaca TaxID=41 RepID=Q9RFL1_STIAU|nr:4'-phosphopantetheinyl transferase superfamily protein [Stigmatella aurantiaca]AAF19809.1 MtaA [Stigmatella aurantiaca DW4/3-1]ADO71799.1 4'-phosphopantetheinyl transferase [Stigmatella aurantiaca DW4/3-1]EAU63926.1 MtaA [Stigmatella aurantiaca DW4/3-1]